MVIDNIANDLSHLVALLHGHSDFLFTNRIRILVRRSIETIPVTPLRKCLPNLAECQSALRTEPIVDNVFFPRNFLPINPCDQISAVQLTILFLQFVCSRTDLSLLICAGFLYIDIEKNGVLSIRKHAVPQSRDEVNTRLWRRRWTSVFPLYLCILQIPFRYFIRRFPNFVNIISSCLDIYRPIRMDRSLQPPVLFNRLQRETIRRRIRRTDNDTPICPVDFAVKNGIVLYRETLVAQFFNYPRIRAARGQITYNFDSFDYILFHVTEEFICPSPPKCNNAVYLIGLAEQTTNPFRDFRTGIQKASSHNSSF